MSLSTLSGHKSHRKIKEIFQERRLNANIFRDKNGKALTESRDKVSRWVEYTEILYKGNVVVGLIENESEL